MRTITHTIKADNPTMHMGMRTVHPIVHDCKHLCALSTGVPIVRIVSMCAHCSQCGHMCAVSTCLHACTVRASCNHCRHWVHPCAWMIHARNTKTA